MVTTFEIVDGVARPWMSAETLDAAATRLPDGAYTTLRTYAGDRVLRLGQHVRRLEESLALLDNPARLDERRLRSAIMATLKVVRLAEARIRLTFAPPRLFISVEPFVTLPAEMYREGVWCVSVRVRRDNPRSKDTRFIPVAAEAYQAIPTGAQEALLCDDDGMLLEGLSSNFFAVCDGVLRTEEDRVLRGVTREIVLEMAREVLLVAPTAVRVAELDTVSECFVTSVSRGILPVVKIDDRLIGEGHPGPVTRELMLRFAALVEREATSLTLPQA